ncbi:LacI family DNA-binding transcriptional regulator [Alicyclobacillus curvatus]|nr:LacI family DNA-binding transcriptional regulator [Alicyclobacillus curvatus]
MTPTIKDVAKLANTSKSTVSRFLNGKPVRQETQQTLRRAIEELNYHPNSNARRLVLNRTQVIAIVVDDISNSFYAPILKGIRSALEPHGYDCVFHTWSQRYPREVDFLRLGYEEQADGLIFVSFLQRSAEDIRLMKDAPFPIVVFGDDAGVAGVYSVDLDNALGISQIVRYLHRLGHRDIAYISGPTSTSATHQRLSGFVATLQDLGISMQNDRIVDSDWSYRGGYEAMRKLLNQGGFTAVVASNDESALGALGAAQEQGYSIPKDFSLTGFDDIGVSRWVYPALTTVRQPLLDLGRVLGGTLLSATIGVFESWENQRVRLNPELVIRNSCLSI